MKYMVFAGYQPERAAAQRAEDSQEMMRAIAAWFEKYGKQGKVVWQGHQLDDAAKTIRAGAGGEPVVTDGPFVESKEVIGGITVLEWDSMDEAVAAAAEWTSFGYGFTMEVRPAFD